MKQALKYGLGMGGGSLLNTELWDYYNHPERKNMFVVDALKGTLSDERKRQGILNGIIGAGGGLGLAHNIGWGEAARAAKDKNLAKGIGSMIGSIGLSGAKDLIATTTPAVNRITEAAENASKATSQLAEGLNAANRQSNVGTAIAAALGTGALGLGALGVAKYLGSKDKKDQARIQYKLQGKEGDPSTEATIDMPIDSPEFSHKLREGLNLGIKRQVGKTIKYNSLKRDQETGKMIPYEKWHNKYNSDGTRKADYKEDSSEKSASADPALKQVEAAKPDYKIKVENGKCCCEACDGHPVSITEAFYAMRAAMGMNDAGSSTHVNEKKASALGAMLTGIGSGAVGAAVGTSLPGDMNPLLKALIGGGAGLGIGAIGHLASTNGQEETAKSYAALGSAPVPAPLGGHPAIDDEDDDDMDKEAMAGPQPPPAAQPKGTNATRQLPPDKGNVVVQPVTAKTDMTSTSAKTNSVAALKNNVRPDFNKMAGIGSMLVGSLIGAGTSNDKDRIGGAIGGAIGGHAGIELGRGMAVEPMLRQFNKLQSVTGMDPFTMYSPRSMGNAKLMEEMGQKILANKAVVGKTLGKMGLLSAGILGLGTASALGGARIGRMLQNGQGSGAVKTAAQANAPAPAPAPADPNAAPPPPPADPNAAPPPPPADPNMPPPPPVPPPPPAPADPGKITGSAMNALDRIKNSLGKLKSSGSKTRSIAALGDSLKAEARMSADKSHSTSLEDEAKAKQQSILG